jgi:polyisoprenoid-binding protein YceI
MKWIFEPGHSAAQFKARHMMMTWVRGGFKDIHGSIEFDPDKPNKSSFEAEIDARKIWTGEKDRDDHLKSSDFFDIKKHLKITFKSTSVKQVGVNEYDAVGKLTIKGITKRIQMHVYYLGQRPTSYWVGDEDKGPIQRAGFLAHTTLNRHDFGISWDKGGDTVDDSIDITIDIEALDAEALKKAEKK